MDTVSKPPFTATEYEQRWSGVFDQMRLRGIEAAVVWSRGAGGFDRFQDVYYLTNYYSCNSGQGYDWMQKGTRAAGNCAAVLRPGEEPILIADDPTLDPDLISTRRIVARTDVVAALADTLAQEGIAGPVAFVGMDCISARHMQDLTRLRPQIEWRDEHDLVLDVRVVKSAAELEAFRAAGETVTCALNALFESILSGGSEADAAGEAAREVYRRQGNMNFCQVAHGPWMGQRLTDFPMAGYSTRTPARGDLVRGWVYGAMHKGYWLDPGRTTVVGLQPTPEQRRLVETGADIVERLRAEIRPGASVREVAMLGKKLRDEFNGVADDEGWFEVFGHGNGLYWDAPMITPGYDGKHQIFREGMVAATEVFLDLPGVGSAGFEQNFIVTAGGTELLTKTPLVWW